MQATSFDKKNSLKFNFEFLAAFQKLKLWSVYECGKVELFQLKHLVRLLKF